MKIEDEEYKEDLEKSLEERPYKSKMPKLKEYEKEEERPEKEIKRPEISIPVLKGLIKDTQSTQLQPLKTIGSKVMGNVFDRVKFLRERIEETNNAIKERERINERFNQEIDSDIVTMETIITKISDREELREFKLNVSLLKMEKRKENTLFWRDVVELKNQLREFAEEFEIETKLSNLFDGLNLE